MSNTLIATAGGFGTLVGWGVSDYLAAKGSRKFNGFEINAAIQLPALIILSLILVFSHQHMPSFDHVATIVFVSLCFTCAYLFFLKALSIGAVGIVTPLANSFPLVTLVLSIVFLAEKFSNLQIAAMVVIVLGGVLLAYEKRRKGESNRFAEKEILFALAATLVWGFGFFIINTVVDKETWQIVDGVLSISMAVIAFMLLWFSERNNIWAVVKRMPKNHVGLISGIVLTLGTIVFYFAGQRTGNILIPAVIGSAGPLVSSMLAAVIDKEQIGRAKRAGAIVVVLGIMLLNIA